MARSGDRAITGGPRLTQLLTQPWHTDFQEVSIVHIVVECPVRLTARVLQVQGMFDLAPAKASRVEWDVDLPLHERDWHIGLIVGPSGSGKSTVARHLFSEPLAAAERLPPWPADAAIVDGFPDGMPIKLVVALLSSVGF